MVRWPAGLHPQGAKRRTSTLAWRPGWRGTGMQPIVPVRIERYGGRLSGVPLTGGQAQAAVPGSGLLTLQVGPQGLGTVWYPIQITLSTTTGVLDTSVALVYLGPLVAQTTLIGTVFSGNGTVANMPESMTPGQTLIVAWSGATPGDLAAVNVNGVMDALTTG